MTVSVLWLFITVPWVDLQCLIVAFLVILTYFSPVYSFVSSQFDHTPPRKERVVCSFACICVYRMVSLSPCAIG